MLLYLPPVGLQCQKEKLVQIVPPPLKKGLPYLSRGGVLQSIKNHTEVPPNCSRACLLLMFKFISLWRLVLQLQQLSVLHYSLYTCVYSNTAA